MAAEQAELLELMTADEVPQPVALALLNDPERPINRDYVIKNIKAGDEYLRILAARKETPKSKKAIYLAALQNDWAGIRDGSPLPLFDAAEVTPPGLCPICAGRGYITGPDGKLTNCSCVAPPPDPKAPEDHERPWRGPMVETMREVFAEIGNGPAAAEPQPAANPEPENPTPRPAAAAKDELKRRERERESAEKK